VYQGIYGATHEELLKHFRKERHYHQCRSIGLSELNGFTYWLFKQRMKRCDKSCFASDTKKALTKLHHYLSLSLRGAQQQIPPSP